MTRSQWEHRRRRQRLYQFIAWTIVIGSSLLAWLGAFAATAYLFGLWHP